MRLRQRCLRQSLCIIFLIDIAAPINKQLIYKIAIIIELVRVGFAAC